MDGHLFSVIAIDLMAATLWLRWLWRMDIYARDKHLRKAVPVFFGVGLLSGPLSMLFYSINPYATTAIGFVSPDAQYYFAVVGPSEELAKFLIFLALSKLLRSIREPVDAVLQGASVGLGFAIVENLLYGLHVDQVTLLFRSYYSVTDHMAWSALSAFSYGAVVYWYERERRPIKWGLVILGVSTSGFLHGLSDYFVMTSWTTFFLSFVMDVAIVVGLMLALQDSRKLSPYYAYPFSEWKKAIRNLDYGIGKDPANWILYQRRGMYLLRAREFYQARSDFELALQLSSTPMCAAWLTAAQMVLGRAEAERALKRALKALDREGRRGFMNSLKEALRGYEPGLSLIKLILKIIMELELPKPKRFAVQTRTGSMDRSPQAIMQARAARSRSVAVILRKSGVATSRAAARAFTLKSEPFRTQKENVLAGLIKLRRTGG